MDDDGLGELEGGAGFLNVLVKLRFDLDKFKRAAKANGNTIAVDLYAKAQDDYLRLHKHITEALRAESLRPAP